MCSLGTKSWPRLFSEIAAAEPFLCFSFLYSLSQSSSSTGIVKRLKILSPYNLLFVLFGKEKLSQSTYHQKDGGLLWMILKAVHGIVERIPITMSPFRCEQSSAFFALLNSFYFSGMIMFVNMVSCDSLGSL